MRANLPKSSTELGAIHIHVDGGQNEAVVRAVLGDLNARGYRTKMQHVLEAVAGPQRAFLPEVYGSHTPGEGGEEQFEFFSTTLIANRDEAVAVLREILPRIQSTPGIVVEAEQVVSLAISSGGHGQMDTTRVSMEQKAEVDIIRSEEVGGYRTAPTWPFEVHHRFDVPKVYDAHPCPMESLLTFAEKNGFCVGGWFVFDDLGSWGYRSNEFMQLKELGPKMRRQSRSMLVGVQNLPFPAQLLTSVGEKVLGIWTT